VPNTVTDIGASAFAGAAANLSGGLVINHALDSLAAGALPAKLSLGATQTGITFPASVTDVTLTGSASVAAANFTGTVTGLTLKGSAVPTGFTGVTGLTLGEGFTGTLTGSGLDSLTSLAGITIDPLVTTYTVTDDVLLSGTTLIKLLPYKDVSGGSYAIPSTVTAIGESAFKNADSDLETITFAGTSVTSIGISAFEGTSITGISIPNSVTTISNSAFKDAAALGSVTFGTGIQTIGENAFSGTAITGAVAFTGTALTSIGAGAFGSVAGITSVNFGTPAAAFTIATGAFTGTGITTLTLPGGANVATGAFGAITALTVTGNLAALHDSAFGNPPVGGFTSLTVNANQTNVQFAISTITTLVIGGSVNSIAAGTFTGLTGLNAAGNTVTIPAGVTIANGSFMDPGNNLATLEEAYADGSDDDVYTFSASTGWEGTS